MAKYIDVSLDKGEFGKAKEYQDDDALVLAVRNIIMSRPGNFPFNPSIGMNIQQYQFDLLDDKMVSAIQTELNRQIAAYVPDLTNIDAQVRKIEDSNGKSYLGISVKANMNGNDENATFLLGKNERINGIDIYNEIT